jgi:hypothetical protein
LVVSKNECADEVLVFCIPGYAIVFHVPNMASKEILKRVGNKLHPGLTPWFIIGTHLSDKPRMMGETKNGILVLQFALTVW